MPSIIHDAPVRHPPRFLTAPYILFGGFTALILLGGLLLWLPMASTHEGANPVRYGHVHLDISSHRYGTYS